MSNPNIMRVIGIFPRVLFRKLQRATKDKSATSKMKNFQMWNFPNVKFPKWAIFQMSRFPNVWFPKWTFTYNQGRFQLFKKRGKTPNKTVMKGRAWSETLWARRGCRGAEPPTIFFKEIALRVSNLSAHKIKLLLKYVKYCHLRNLSKIFGSGFSGMKNIYI